MTIEVFFVFWCDITVKVIFEVFCECFVLKVVC
jgi:hypothetical protein